MSDMNLCIFQGNLTRDPETREVGNGSVTKFSIAVNSGFGNNRKSIYVECEAWDKTGEFVAQYFKAGKPIRVYTELAVDSYEKDGVKVNRSKYRVDKAFFVNTGKADEDKAGEDESEKPKTKTAAKKGADTKPAATRTTRTPKPKQEEPEEDGGDDDDSSIPF